MITVSPIAAERLSAYLSENNIESPVRITAMYGCGGPSLGLALDERKENDRASEQDHLTLLIAEDLSAQCGRVGVDFIEQSGEGGGFSITSERPLPGSGGCGGSCGGGSCGC